MYSIVFAAPINSRSGYGARSLDIARSLLNLGYNVGFIMTTWGACPNNVLDENNANDLKILERVITGPLTYKPSVFIQCTIPNEFQSIGDYNIGITAGIETDICQLEWIEGCNRMDMVLVSSKHSQNVFKNIKFEKVDKTNNSIVELIQLTSPCEVLFEGCDIDTYCKKNIVDLPIIFGKNKLPDFNFLFVGHWLQGELGADRKDIGMLIHTFLNTFVKIHPKNQPGLILKTSGAGFSITEREEIINKINSIRKLVKQTNPSVNELPPVILLHGDLSDTEMNSLYNHPKIKAMVSFTHGEGFGRPLLEFKPTNKPIIVSAWGGQTDFLDKDTSILLPGNITPVHPSSVNNWILKESKWFTVNYSVAAQFLYDIYRNYPTYLEKCKKNSMFVNNNFSLKKMGESLNTFIKDKVLDVPIVTQLQLPINN